MDGLETFDTAQLEAELKRRKEEEEEGAKPKPIDSPDWSDVVECCIFYIDELHTKGYAHSDSKQYIFEEAVSAVFGRTVWKWINEVLA